MIHISGHRCGIIPESGIKDVKSYFCVNCCGFEKYITKNIHTLRKEGRLDYQIIYITKGCGSFFINGVMTTIPYGNIIIFRPEEMQHYAYYYQDAPELYWVHFTGYGVESYLNSINLHHKSTHYIGIHNVLIEHFKKIMLELQVKSPLYEQTADAMLMELMASMARKKIILENPSSKFSDPHIQKIVEHMHTACDQPWNINDLAKKCLLSPNRFMHKFKAQTGFSAMDYLMQIRIAKAKDLLINSQLNIKEISNLIGYENPLYFSRLFHKIEGMSPREYRKQK